MTTRPIPVLLMARALDAGGTERQLAEIARSLPADRFEAHVAAFQGGGMRWRELEAAGIPVTEIRVTSLRPGPGLATGVSALRAYLRRHGIALVHTWDYPATLFGVPTARACGVPVVLASQRGERSRLPWTYRNALRATDRIADGVVVNCLFIRDELVNRFGTKPDKILLCRNGIDTRRFYGGERTGETRVVGAVSLLRPEKGIDVLIEGFARADAPKTELVIVGSGPCEGALRRQAEGLGLLPRVRFVPSTPDVAEWYRRFDVFVLPSRSEALSNSLLEAMASGCCPVVSATGGNVELVTHQSTGLWFRAGDAAALAEQLSLALRSPGLTKELASAACARVCSHFTLEVAARRMAEVYEAYLSKRGRVSLREETAVR